MVRIATWNVNSIRSRIDRVEAWLERTDVDVLAIQETKCREDQFPFDRFEALGYAVAHHGLSQWNGVAIASRVGLDDVSRGFPDVPHWGEPAVAEARAIGATCNGIRLWSLYVPNGRALEDPHMDYKLAWLEQLRVQTAAWAAEGATLRAHGRLEHRTPGRGRLVDGLLPRQEPRQPARARRLPGRPRRRRQ